ncbi:MAG: TetR/AcrR family transcriptional regulator [Candidatus Thiodiazotropha sp.]
MRQDSTKKEETRRRMLDAMHRGFRSKGYDAAGVDGLAKAAGVTSGAFYKHFGSKADAFKESVALGVEEFRAAVEDFQKKHGDNWLEEFGRFYLGEKRCTDLAESCGLQSLSPEVMRSDTTIRKLFQLELQRAASSFNQGLDRSNQQDELDRTWSKLALLVGGVTLARAVSDPSLADEIADAVFKALVTK